MKSQKSKRKNKIPASVAPPGRSLGTLYEDDSQLHKLVEASRVGGDGSGNPENYESQIRQDLNLITINSSGYGAQNNLDQEESK
jgi:hypothetical protein